MSDSLRCYGMYPTRPLCPWDSPSKDTGVGCHALLQGIFLTQGSNPCHLCLLHWVLYHQCYLGRLSHVHVIKLLLDFLLLIFLMSIWFLHQSEEPRWAEENVPLLNRGKGGWGNGQEIDWCELLAYGSWGRKEEIQSSLAHNIWLNSYDSTPVAQMRRLRVTEAKGPAW